MSDANQIIELLTRINEKVDGLTSDINAVNERVAQLELASTVGQPGDPHEIYDPASGVNALGLKAASASDPQTLSAAGKATYHRAMAFVEATPDGEEMRRDASGHVLAVGNTTGRPRGLMEQVLGGGQG